MKKTGLDLAVEDAMLAMADPRPLQMDHINGWIENTIKQLDHCGYLAQGLSETEMEHMGGKLKSLVRGLIIRDRKEFHGINETSDGDE